MINHRVSTECYTVAFKVPDKLSAVTYISNIITMINHTVSTECYTVAIKVPDKLSAVIYISQCACTL